VLRRHGLPASRFLCRKVPSELEARDLPGLGLAALPIDFVYTFTGLGQFAVAAARSRPERVVANSANMSR
jgi:hypothetical protein